MFYIEKNGVYALGISANCEGKVYADDFVIENDVTSAEKVEATKSLRDELQLKLNEAKELLKQSSLYTDESVTKLNGYVHDAEVAVLRENILPKELTQVMNNLTAGINGLVEKSSDSSSSLVEDSSSRETDSSSNSTENTSSSVTSGEEDSSSSSLGETENSSRDTSGSSVNGNGSNKKGGCSGSISSSTIVLLIALAMISVVMFLRKDRK